MDDVFPPAKVDGQSYEELLGFVKQVSARYMRRLPRHIEMQDLVGAGHLGLAEAAAKHGGAPAADFQALARCRIRGAIGDELRRHDPVKRRTRKKVRELVQTERRLATELQRAPEEAEVAAEMSITQSDCRALRLASATRQVSLDRPAVSGDHTTTPTEPPTAASIAPDELVAKSEVVGRIRKHMPHLTQREQEVIQGLYERDHSVREIAENLGISQPRVCQIHGAAIAKLRQLVAA